MAFHSRASLGAIHKVHNWEVADIPERDALPVTSLDLGKVVRVGAGAATEWYVLASEAPVIWQPLTGGAADLNTPAILSWGARSVADTVTTRFLLPGWENGTAPTTIIQQQLATNFVFGRMSVVHNSVNVGGTETLTYTLVLNGSPSPLFVTLGEDVASASESIVTVPVPAGTFYGVQVTKSGVIANGVLRPTVTFEAL